MKRGHCFSTNASFLAAGMFNVISDFAIFFIPMKPLWNLQMPKKRKYLLVGLFATGFSLVNTRCLMTTLLTRFI